MSIPEVTQLSRTEGSAPLLKTALPEDHPHGPAQRAAAASSAPQGRAAAARLQLNYSGLEGECCKEGKGMPGVKGFCCGLSLPARVTVK